MLTGTPPAVYSRMTGEGCGTRILMRLGLGC